jgi:GNAT superfamily N-acetyltransferase
MQIREAQEIDIAAIATVHVASWRSTYRGLVPDDHLAALSVPDRERRWRETFPTFGDPHCIFVAEDPRLGIIGFADGGPSRDRVGGLAGELYAIYLLEQSQRQGVGRRLVGAVASRLLATGLNAMSVWVIENNPACGFYEAMGGVRIGNKAVVIGGATLAEVAYGWTDLQRLAENA